MTTHNVNFTREEAIAFSFALDSAQRHLVETIAKLQRKRTIQSNARILALNAANHQLDKITKLNDRIQRAAQIRGY